MFGMTPWKKKQAKAFGNGGAVTQSKDYPFALSRMRDEFDRLFDRFTQDWPWSSAGSAGWRWGLDVKNEENAVLVRAEAPGFDPEDFEIQVRGNQLLLRATHKSEKKDQQGNMEHYEEQQCYEEVPLPPGIDEGNITAKYTKGVLTITLPKTESSKGTKVPVTGG